MELKPATGGIGITYSCGVVGSCGGSAFPYVYEELVDPR
jgi:hypothetical protein